MEVVRRLACPLLVLLLLPAPAQALLPPLVREPPLPVHPGFHPIVAETLDPATEILNRTEQYVRDYPWSSSLEEQAVYTYDFVDDIVDILLGEINAGPVDVTFYPERVLYGLHNAKIGKEVYVKVFGVGPDLSIFGYWVVRSCSGVC